MVAITFKETALPDFGDANALALAGAKQYETAVRGLQEAAKGIQEKVRNQNTARIQDYINKAANAAELRSPEYQEGLQAFLGTLGHEYDALGTTKAVDARFDTLNQRERDAVALTNAQDQLGFNKQQTVLNDQSIASNTYKADSLATAAAIADNTRNILSGKTTPEQVLAQGGQFDPVAIQQFNQSNGTYNLSQRVGEQGLKNSQQNYVITGNKESREAQKFNLEVPELQLGASIAKGNLGQLEADNPQLRNKQYTHAARNMQTPGFVKSFEKYGTTVDAAAAKYGVDPKLVWSVIGQESAGGVGAVSPTGVKGIMQVTQDTFNNMKVGNDRTNPVQSIEAGTKYLGQLLQRYEGDTAKAVAAYNSGMGSVDKAIKTHGDNWLKGIRKQGQDYVPSVLGGYEYARTGNDGSKFTTPNTLSTSRGGNSTQSATQLQKAYENSPEGIVANFKKTEGDLKTKSFTAPGAAFGGGTYKNPTEWATSMKDSGSDAMVTNMLDVTRKNNFKFSDKTAEKEFNKEGVKDWGKLSDNQKAGVLERAYNNLMQQNSSVLGLRTWNVGDADLAQFQKAIQAETDALLKPNKDTYARQLASNRVNTFNRLKQQYKLTDAQAVEYMQLDNESAQRLLGTTKTPPKAATTTATTPDSELKDFAAKVKLSYPNSKVPQAILNSLQGRAAAKAGLL